MDRNALRKAILAYFHEYMRKRLTNAQFRNSSWWGYGCDTPDFFRVTLYCWIPSDMGGILDEMVIDSHCYFHRWGIPAINARLSRTKIKGSNKPELLPMLYTAILDDCIIVGERGHPAIEDAFERARTLQLLEGLYE